MADAQAQALAALTAAIDTNTTEVGQILTALTAALNAAANLQPDDSAAIMAQVTRLQAANASMAAAIPDPAAPAPAAAPAAPSA